MELQIFYFDTKHANKVHDWIIENSGGRPGYENIGLIDSVLDHIQNDMYYPSFVEKLKHLVFAVNKFHAFTVGNKRSGLVLGAYFLELNGYDYCVNKFIQEMENIGVWVADNKINDMLLLDILKSIIEEDEFSESLKLRIFEAVEER